MKRKKAPVRRKRDAHGRFLKKVHARRTTTRRANPMRAKKTHRRRRRNPEGGFAEGPPTRAEHAKSRRKAAAAKAVATRAARRAVRSAIAKKAAETRRKNKELGLVARKKAKKAKKATHRRGLKRSHASYVKAAKKAARTRKRHMKAAGKAAPRKRRHVKKASAKKAVRRRKVRVVKKLSLAVRRGSHRRRKYGVTRRVKRSGFFKYGLKKISRNPASAMLHALQTAGVAYLGFVGVRALNVQIKALMDKSSSLTSYSKFLAPAASFLLATVAAPKALGKNPKLIEALQYGAVFALGDAILKSIVPTTGSISQSVIGLSDFGGFQEYIPLREYTPEPLQLGANVEEAMALDEYVEGMGAEVEEALASPGLSADEMSGFQTGYAGGTLAKTVFSD